MRKGTPPALLRAEVDGRKRKKEKKGSDRHLKDLSSKDGYRLNYSLKIDIVVSRKPSVKERSVSKRGTWECEQRTKVTGVRLGRGFWTKQDMRINV